MIQITMVIPYEDMRDIAIRGFEKTRSLRENGILRVSDFSYSIVCSATTEDLSQAHFDGDVLIARGAMAYDLQRGNYKIPVVELRFGSQDMLYTLNLLRQKYGTTPAAIIGSPNMIQGAEELGAQVGVCVQGYQLVENTEAEIYRNVIKAIKDGCKIILGGHRGCTYAHNLGAEVILLQSVESSVLDAIHLALQIADTSRRNHAEALRNKAMLDYAFEGLISLDEHNHITGYNEAAQKILGTPTGDWWVGQSIRDALRNGKITALAKTATPYIEDVIYHNNTYISFRKVGIDVHGEYMGCVLTFMNVSQIKSTEEKFRKKLLATGHVTKYSFEDITCQSDCMKATISMARAYAATQSNVMLYGETGTGKELFSQSIHAASPRSEQPFVAINCGAIPESLLESELFGYVAGAFTGASKEGKMGLFEQAHNGTLFLDEIGELPLSLQSRLLRVLQEREILRLGDDKVVTVNVRVIAATHRNLLDLIEQGTFRQDLYYRLHVLSLQIPPLRSRSDDIPSLVEQYTQLYRQELDYPPLVFSPQAMELLQSQPWPGNIRELRNFCERLSVLTNAQFVSHLWIVQLLAQDLIKATSNSPKKTPILSDQFILDTLAQCNGNKTQAAKQLGISRVTLWRRLSSLLEEQ